MRRARLDPVELRHLHVEDREIRTLARRQSDRLLAVPRLRADLETGLLERLAEVEPDDRLVLSDEGSHPQSLGGEAHLGPQPTSVVAERERPFQLVVDECADDREARAFLRVAAPLAVVRDREAHVAVPALELDAHLLAPVFERVLEEL